MIRFLCFLVAFLATVFAQQQEINLHDFIAKHGFAQLFGDETGEYEIITPIHHNRYQRSMEGHPDEQFFTLEAFGERFQMDLQKTTKSYAPMIKVVSRNEDGTVTETDTVIENCLYHGSLSTHQGSSVAVSTCNGLSGLIRTTSGDYIIQPLPDTVRSRRDVHDDAHIIFKKKTSGERFCAADKNRKSIFTEPRTKRYQPGISAAQANELTIETAVFVDYDLYQHFRTSFPQNFDNQLLQYVLAMMNAIQLLYNEPSLLGKPINFILIRLDIFKTNRPSFHITDDAEVYLDSFCLWQQKMNPGTDNDPDHWDHAFMLTGLDIQAGGSYGVIGIAPLSGMCKPQISCTLTEAKFFQGVFTGGHEAGHNFGMQHDGTGNACDSHKFIMAPMDEAGQVTWSTCSRSQMIQYLQNPVTACLLDNRRPGNLDHTANGRLPGQRFDANIQCSLGFGPSFRPEFTQQLNEICYILKCTDGQYIQKAHPALEGTYCGPGAWCRGGRCVSAGNGLISVNGGWGQWSAWTECQSSCLVGGTGVSSSSRQCNNPSPSNGGQDCQGEKTKTNLCNDGFCRNRMSNLDYASTICRKAPSNFINQITGAGGQLFHDETGGCLVWCEKRAQRGQFTGWGVTFPDGTDCSQGRGGAFCIQGNCQKGNGGPRGYRQDKKGIITPRWEVSEWGTCSKECDGGIQTRVVQCVIDWKPDIKKIIPSIECIRLGDAIPETEKTCNEQFCVLGIPRDARESKVPRWEISEWGKCDKECDGGTQTREVQCIIDWKTDIQKVIPSIECGTMPEKERRCNEQLCIVGVVRQERAPLIVPEWEMSEWTPCSKQCGGGSQSRILKCIIDWQGKKMETMFSECDKVYGRPEKNRKCNVQKC